MPYFKDYQDAATFAQDAADSTGFDQGIEAVPDGTWRTFGLPRKENRQGHELRCEVRYCTDISKCRKGHGGLNSLIDAISEGDREGAAEHAEHLYQWLDLAMDEESS